MNIIVPSLFNDRKTWEVASTMFRENSKEFSDSVFAVYKSVDEKHMLTGLYEPTQQFFNFALPEMRRQLQNFLAGKEHVQIFPGEEVGTLFAAYYTHLAGVKYSLTIRDLERLGGASLWAQTHPLTLNKLVTSLVRHAVEIEINGEHFLPKMKDQFPNIPREYIAITIPGHEIVPRDGDVVANAP